MVRVSFDPATDYYGLLGVPTGASAEQIQTAYRRLAKAYHPDLNAGSSLAATRMARVNVAKSVLLDPSSRALYDQLRVTHRAARVTSASGRTSSAPAAASVPASAARRGPTRPTTTTTTTTSWHAAPEVSPTPPGAHVRHRVSPRGTSHGGRGGIDRGTGLVLLIGLPLIAALSLYLLDAVHVSVQPLRAAPSDVVLAQMPPPRSTAHSAADAVFLMVHAQPPSRDLAAKVNNFILARADSTPESVLLQQDGRRLLRSASTGDTAAWDAVVADLCYLAGHC